MNRHLHEKLFLVVQRKGESGWYFPNEALQGEEDLRATAERALAQAVDTAATKTYFIGNAPSAVHTRNNDKVWHTAHTRTLSFNLLS